MKHLYQFLMKFHAIRGTSQRFKQPESPSGLLAFGLRRAKESIAGPTTDFAMNGQFVQRQVEVELIHDQSNFRFKIQKRSGRSYTKRIRLCGSGKKSNGRFCETNRVDKTST